VSRPAGATERAPLRSIARSRSHSGAALFREFTTADGKQAHDVAAYLEAE
jgi:hypothetical protein